MLKTYIDKDRLKVYSLSKIHTYLIHCFLSDMNIIGQQLDLMRVVSYA